MNPNIPFGKENKARKAKYRKFNEEHENALVYSDIFGDVKVHNTTKDNTKWAYNGDGRYYDYGVNKVRIPSIKRSDRTWRNFYTLFPEYYDILIKCLEGKIKHNRTKNCVIVSSFLNYNFSALIKNSLVKLKIIEM